MAKRSGQTRTIRPSSNTKEENYAHFRNQLANNPEMDPEHSYFSHASGGYLLSMKGRKFDEDEHAAATAMADAGMEVILTTEGGVKFRTGKTNKGDYVYADGLVNGHTFEQQTKNPSDTSDNRLITAVDRALKHAYEKRAEIPLIYDKYGKFHREHIEGGIARFEEHLAYRFKAILVVDQHRNVWEHGHNK